MNTTLDAPMLPDNDAEAATVRDYLKALLTTLLTEQEGFSGKRPFGNSGWMGDLEIALIRAGLVEGKLDEDGYIEDCDSADALTKLLEAVKSWGVGGD